MNPREILEILFHGWEQAGEIRPGSARALLREVGADLPTSPAAAARLAVRLVYGEPGGAPPGWLSPDAPSRRTRDRLAAACRRAAPLLATPARREARARERYLRRAIAAVLTARVAGGAGPQPPRPSQLWARPMVTVE